MLSTAHLMTGAAVASSTHNPWEIIVISIVLHFVWDSFPHWDPDYEKWNKRDWYLVASLDMLLGILLVFWVVGANLNWLIMIGMFFSILPDILTMVIILGKIKILKPYLEWHKKIQNVAKLKYGLIFQIIVVVVSVIVIKMSVLN